MSALHTPSAFMDDRAWSSTQCVASQTATRIHFLPEELGGLIGPKRSMVRVSNGVDIMGVSHNGALSALRFVAVSWHSGHDWTKAFISLSIPGQKKCLEMRCLVLRAPM